MGSSCLSALCTASHFSAYLLSKQAIYINTMSKLPFSTLLLMAVLVSISSAAAWTSISQPVRDLQSLTVVNERKRSRGFLATKRFSTVSEQEETPAIKQKVEVTKISADEKPTFKISLPTIASVFTATFGTYLLNNQLAMGPVKASSIAGLGLDAI